MVELTTKDIQYMIDYLERTRSLFESEDSRQCYHMGMVKLKLHISILKQLLEDKECACTWEESCSNCEEHKKSLGL